MHEAREGAPSKRETPPDYAGTFSLTVADADATSAEQWARGVFEGAPRWFQGLLGFGWRIVLALRLGPGGAADNVLGWRVRKAGDGSVVLEGDGPLIWAENIVEVGASQVSWTTVVRYRHPVGRVAWTLIQPIHKLTIPRLLARAARLR